MFSREELLEQERLIVRHSGEIPEIAFHNALYHLTRDPSGPGLVLAPAEIRLLEDQAIARYREIILRDLDPDCRNTPVYRGVARSITNWRRLHAFLGRQGRSLPPGLDGEVGRALQVFLAAELATQARGEKTCVNCSAGEIELFCAELELSPDSLPRGWRSLCT